MRTHTHSSTRRCRGIAAAGALVFASTVYTLVTRSQDQFNSGGVINHLNAAIAWYRDATSKVQGVGLPTDAIYQDNAQSLAGEAVRLAFQSARAEAGLISAADKSSGGNTNSAASEAGQTQDLSQMEAKVSGEIADSQTQIDALNKQIAAAAGSKKQGLISQRDRLQGQLDLDKALQESIRQMAGFVESSTESSTEGLQGSINELAHSVPEVFAAPNAQKPVAKPVAAQGASTASTGLLSQVLALYAQMRSVHQIDLLANETANLRSTAVELRSPLRDMAKATLQRGRDLAGQPAASTPAQPQGARQEFDSLTANFKQISNALLPLSQEIVILDQSRSNLLEWRISIMRNSRTALMSLLTRVAMIALAFVFLLILSEVWRRFTFRYVRDARRRRQFLLLRRVVIGFLMGVVLILGFVSEFSSLATFAGFATAGIAVALQAVLLSMAAYFFLIGRYGIRVGDRISISGVTGDVIDIGLVRLYLMELAGTGVDLFPTGRIVVFSNAVLFQAATPLFKQIPGTEYTWHEVAITLTPGGNYKDAQEKVMKAVNSVYARYKGEIERQYGNVERRIDIQMTAPSPDLRLRFADAGLELSVRFPVEIRRASEVDDEMTRSLLEIVNQDADLKASVAGSPKIRSAVRG
jgi:small-conductance mechanosensitive channel